MIQHLQGDCRDVLKTLADKSVDCCVTSPPYWGLRDYGVEEQIGLEETPERYVENMVNVFREVNRVLKDEGTLWLNLGDTFGEHKQLLGIPWRVAFALQHDGWILRSEIIWHKPNVMPESVTDRPTRAHESIFLLTKSEKYFYDAASIKEPAIRPGEMQTFGGQKGRDYEPTKGDPNYRGGNEQWGRTVETPTHRNKRSVWTVSSHPYAGAHFAVFPPDLIRPCIFAGCPSGGTVLDPFGGSGTTAMVAEQEGRNAILIELNPEYIDLQKQRTAQMSLLAT